MTNGASAPRGAPSPLTWPLLTFAAILLAQLIFSPGFFHFEIKDGRLYGSLIDILNRAAPVMLLSLGMTLVIATGGVDLSVGAIMAIAAALAGTVLVKNGSGAGAALALGLLGGLLAGAWNGSLVALVRVQPIVATLILMVTGRGVAQLLTKGQILTFENPRFEYLGRGAFCGLPFPVILVLAFACALGAATRRTALGLFLESTGDNETASRYAGVPTRAIKLFAYSVSGLGAALAGLIAASDIKAADANNVGLWLELDAILAVVIGGTPLLGGRFFLLGSLVGALLIQTLTTTILTLGIRVEFTLVIKAVVVIVVCLLPSPAFRRSLLKPFRRVRP